MKRGAVCTSMGFTLLLVLVFGCATTGDVRRNPAIEESLVESRLGLDATYGFFSPHVQVKG